jgi:hypothetical protein
MFTALAIDTDLALGLAASLPTGFAVATSGCAFSGAADFRAVFAGAAKADPDGTAASLEPPATPVIRAIGGTTGALDAASVTAGSVTTCGIGDADLSGALEEEDTVPHGIICFLKVISTLLPLKSPEPYLDPISLKGLVTMTTAFVPLRRSPAPNRRPRFLASFRTITALILREMATTYGRSPGGYLWAVLEPVAGVALLSLVFSLALRNP